MNGKYPSCDIVAYSSKNARKTINLDMKLNVLKGFDAGGDAVDISCTVGLPVTTVRIICANPDKIRKCTQSVTILSAARIT